MDFEQFKNEISLNLIIVVTLLLTFLLVSGYMVVSSFDSDDIPIDSDKEQTASIDFQEIDGKLYVTASNIPEGEKLYVYSSVAGESPKERLTQREPLILTNTDAEAVLYSSSIYSTTENFSDPNKIGEVMYYSQFTTITVMNSEDTVISTWENTEE